jgi:hypothetical protein
LIARCLVCHVCKLHSRNHCSFLRDRFSRARSRYPFPATPFFSFLSSGMASGVKAC